MIEEPLEPSPPASLGVRMSHALGMHGAGRALRDFLTYLPAQLLPALASALALLLLPRRLQPTPYGILQIALGAASAGWILTSAWLTGSIVRELPAATVRDDVASFAEAFARALRIVAALFVAFAALLSLAAIFSLAVKDNLGLIILVTAGLVVQNLAVTLYSASLRPRPYAIVLLLSRVGGIGAGIWLVYQGKGVAGYLLALGLFSFGVGGVALVGAFPRAHGRKPKELARVRDWAAFGIPSGVSSFVVWAMLFIDRFLLAGLRSTGEVGVYSLGATIGSQAVSIPAAAFMTGARPLAMKAYAEKGRAEVERLMRAWTRIVLLIALPASAFVTVTGEALLRLGPGSQRHTIFFPAVRVIPLLALGTTIFVLAGIGNLGLVVARHVRPLIWSSVLGLAANVGVNAVLIPHYGIVGAAISAPISSAVYLAAGQTRARRYASWHFPLGTLLRASLASAGAAAVGWLTIHALKSPLSQGRAGEALVLALATGGLTYVGALAVLGELRRVPER